MMKNTVLIDQYALTKLGADKGLGRYTSLLSAGIERLPHVSVRTLSPVSSSGFIPEIFRIQADIARSKLPKAVPYHATSVYHLPLFKDRPWICSIQDVIALDLVDYRKLGIKSKILFANARRSDLIVANSDYTRQRIISRLHIPIEKIVTCPLPISTSFHDTPSAESLDRVKRILEARGVDIFGPFVVALIDLRTPDPRKRYHWIDELAHALKGVNVPMVVTGRGLVQDYFSSSTVIPALSDSELSALYSKSTAMYYPSAYEGQGLPPQEAMASGCPVVAYRNTSVQEVVGSADFLLDDPVPWERQSLELSLSKTAIDEVLTKITNWTDSQPALANARREAQTMASRYSFDRFDRDLAKIYAHAPGVLA